jgi:hypothetical protein
VFGTFCHPCLGTLSGSRKGRADCLIDSLFGIFLVRDLSAYGRESISQGLITDAPMSSKSPRFRVTMIRSWTMADAAIRPLASPRGRSAESLPHSTAIRSVIGKMRSAWS